MSLVNAGQVCVPVSSLARAAAVAADVSEGKLINLDTSSQAQSHLPVILPQKTRTHLGVHPPAVKVTGTNKHRHMCAYTYVVSRKHRSH